MFYLSFLGVTSKASSEELDWSSTPSFKPFLKDVMPFPKSPIIEEIFPLPPKTNNAMTSIIIICKGPIAIFSSFFIYPLLAPLFIPCKAALFNKLNNRLHSRQDSDKKSSKN